MLEGSCHCGAIRWRFNGMPESATACNCTVCRRYGTLWAYGYQDVEITVEGESRFYMRPNGNLEFHFCGSCGCVGWWRAARVGRSGRRRIAVNLRLAEPDPVAALPIDHFEGLKSFEDLPRDGRCVADMWF